MRFLLRLAIVTAAVTVVVLVAWPLLERAVRGVRIVLQPAPSSLPVPVEGVSVRALRDSWGAPRGGGRSHRGIDIFAPRGTAVRAATAGIVLRVGENRLGGNIVTVLGPGRQVHYYAHLDRFAAVRAGDVVGAGTSLGYVGDSGNARGGPPHLHYGIYTRRGAINPFPLLTAASPRAGSGT
jgi:murein DD-endopeptidase MepM/ murein hydrolase activator NlpD